MQVSSWVSLPRHFILGERGLGTRWVRGTATFSKSGRFWKKNLAPTEKRITIPWTSHHMDCRVRKQVSAVSTTTLLYFTNLLLQVSIIFEPTYVQWSKQTCNIYISIIILPKETETSRPFMLSILRYLTMCDSSEALVSFFFLSDRASQYNLSN